MAKILSSKQELKEEDLYTVLMKTLFRNPALIEFVPEMAFFDCTNTDWTHLFTERRLQLLRLVAQRSPKNITEVAEMTKRDIENVYRDLKILEQFGLIKLEKHGRETIPIIEKPVVVIMFKK